MYDSPPTLIVDFVDDVRQLGPDDELTFGREGDLSIDANPYLHRSLGTFRSVSGTWWLTNRGSSIALNIIDSESPSRLSLAPGASTPLPFRLGKVSFQAGPSNYEIEFEVETASPVSSHPAMIDETGTATITAATASLNQEQRLLLVVLAAPRLRSGTSDDLPTNREAAATLGWTSTKFNRKLDNLCIKFDRLGVQGLKGDLAGLASMRRERLVEHLINAGVITVDDLALLEDRR